MFFRTNLPHPTSTQTTFYDCQSKLYLTLNCFTERCETVTLTGNHSSLEHKEYTGIRQVDIPSNEWPSGILLVYCTILLTVTINVSLYRNLKLFNVFEMFLRTKKNIKPLYKLNERICSDCTHPFQHSSSEKWNKSFMDLITFKCC